MRPRLATHRTTTTSEAPEGPEHRPVSLGRCAIHTGYNPDETAQQTQICHAGKRLRYRDNLASCVSRQERYLSPPLPSERFHALLTLFPKYFSSFPHGTCALSGHGTIQPCLSTTNHLTLHFQRTRFFEATLNACDFGRDEILTLSEVLLRTNLVPRHNWLPLLKLQLGTSGPLPMQNAAEFIRHYSRHHFRVLLLHLLICLNSAGTLP